MDDGVFGFILGFVVAVFISSLVFLIGDGLWADARNRMMSQCVEKYTYDSCIESWYSTPQKATLKERP